MPKWAALALLSCLLPASPAGASEQAQILYYQGVIASINHSTGEFVIMGRKDDLPDDLIVKLKVDPAQVAVMTAYEENLGFTSLEKGDEIQAECRLEEGTVFVDSIFIFGLKDSDIPVV